MQTVWATLDRSKTDLFTFLVGVGIVVIGFSVLGHFIYGTRLEEWHNFASSMSSLLRFALGDADYDLMASIRPQLTPVYFVAYTAIVFLVALNLIIGIISEAFDQTYDDIFMSDRWKGTVVTLEEDTQAQCNILQLQCNILCRTTVCSCCCPLEQLDEDGQGGGSLVSRESADASEDRYSNTIAGKCMSAFSACCGSSSSPQSSSVPNTRNLEMTTPNPMRKETVSGVARQSDHESKEATAPAEEPSAGDALPLVQVAGGGAPRSKEERLLSELQATQQKWGKLLDCASACSDLAKHNGQPDLYEWIRAMYKFMPDSDSMYVTEMSLTLLTQNGVDVHGEPHETAKALVAAYHDLKRVEVVTNPVPLEPPIERYKRLAAGQGGGHRSSSASAGSSGGAALGSGHHMQMFKVDKVNVDGVVQTRRLWIDIGTRVSGELEASKADGAAPPCHLFLEPTLYNFDSQLRLKKRLPLRQMVLVERLHSDDRRINLVFSSQGSDPEEEENIGGLETTYTLQFSQRARRDEFHEVLQQALKHVEREEVKMAEEAKKEQEEREREEKEKARQQHRQGGATRAVQGGALSAWGAKMQAAARASQASTASTAGGGEGEEEEEGGVQAAQPAKKSLWGRAKSSLRNLGAATAAAAAEA